MQKMVFTIPPLLGSPVAILAFAKVKFRLKTTQLETLLNCTMGNYSGVVIRKAKIRWVIVLGGISWWGTAQEAVIQGELSLNLKELF